MTPPTAPSQEHIVREIAYMREELRDADYQMQRIQVGALTVYIAFLGWMVNRAFQPPYDAPFTDATIWALRDRGDLAMAVYALPLVMLLLVTATYYAAAIRTATERRLNSFYDITGFERFNAAAHREVLLWVWVFLAVVLTTGAALAFFGYFFFDPAVQRSFLLGHARTLAVVSMAVTIALSVGHATAMYRMATGRTSV